MGARGSSLLLHKLKDAFKRLRPPVAVEQCLKSMGGFLQAGGSLKKLRLRVRLKGGQQAARQEAVERVTDDGNQPDLQRGACK